MLPGTVLKPVKIRKTQVNRQKPAIKLLEREETKSNLN